MREAQALKIVLLLLGIVAIIAGLVLTGQGAGIIPPFRSSSLGKASDLALYGVVIAAIGLMLIGMSSRRN
jgi:hypothetical protein